jgi:hypothetical protein
LTGGMKGVGGEVKGEMVKARPGREGGIEAPRVHDIEGECGVGEKAVPEVNNREVGASGSVGGDRVVLACPQ